MNELTISLVAAARPNFMKIKPVLDALEARGAKVQLVHTGQHYDPAMSDVFFEDLGLRDPDFHLGVGSGTHAEQSAGVMVAYEQLLALQPVDAVVVAGDVNSTLACGLVGAKAGALVAHIEAGLRSRDWSMPEEVNRVVVDRLSDLLFAPSHDAVENLRTEGYRPDQIHLVGNVMIDTLLANVERAQNRSVRTDLGLPDDYGLITMHRPSNVDDPKTLEPLMGALSELAKELPLVFPVHPRTRPALAPWDDSPGLFLVEPQGYLDFLNLEASARLVLTDSGGIQEETTALGVPCLTLRENTERPITILEGTNQLVGTQPDNILATARAVLEAPPEPQCPALWDGKAAQRIADTLVGALSTEGRPRPTDLGL